MTFSDPFQNPQINRQRPSNTFESNCCIEKLLERQNCQQTAVQSAFKPLINDIYESLIQMAALERWFLERFICPYKIVYTKNKGKTWEVLKPHTNVLRPGVLFVFSLHLFYESLSLGSLPHPHHHQGLVVTFVCQGALQEEGKHTGLVSDEEICHRHCCISYKSKGRTRINRLRELTTAAPSAPHLTTALPPADRA